MEKITTKRNGEAPGKPEMLKREEPEIDRGGAAQEVQIQSEDILRILLMQERGRRIEAEKQAHDADNRNFLQSLSTKYGIDLAKYSINVERAVAVRIAS